MASYSYVFLLLEGSEIPSSYVFRLPARLIARNSNNFTYTYVTPPFEHALIVMRPTSHYCMTLLDFTAGGRVD